MRTQAALRVLLSLVLLLAEIAVTPQAFAESEEPSSSERWRGDFLSRLRQKEQRDRAVMQDLGRPVEQEAPRIGGQEAVNVLPEFIQPQMEEEVERVTGEPDPEPAAAPEPSV